LPEAAIKKRSFVMVVSVWCARSEIDLFSKRFSTPVPSETSWKQSDTI